MVIVKRQNREDFFPVEVCKLIPGQIRAITPEERSDVISATRKELSDRFHQLTKHSQELRLLEKGEIR